MWGLEVASHAWQGGLGFESLLAQKKDLFLLNKWPVVALDVNSEGSDWRRNLRKGLRSYQRERLGDEGGREVEPNWGFRDR